MLRGLDGLFGLSDKEMSSVLAACHPQVAASVARLMDPARAGRVLGLMGSAGTEALLRVAVSREPADEAGAILSEACPAMVSGQEERVSGERGAALLLAAMDKDAAKAAREVLDGYDSHLSERVLSHLPEARAEVEASELSRVSQAPASKVASEGL